MLNIEAFKKDLEDLINKHSLENLCDTPDFILADYLIDCFVSYTRTVSQRDRWFGVDMWHGRLSTTNYHKKYVQGNIVFEPPYDEPPSQVEVTKVCVTCNICGEDLSLWAGVCPNRHEDNSREATNIDTICQTCGNDIYSQSFLCCILALENLKGK